MLTMPTRTALPTVMLCATGLLLSLAFAGQSAAAKRVALVIGNAVYAHAPRLANPLNDAGDIGAALGRLGYAVTKLENADREALWRGLQEFTDTASGAEAAVVFYAGHGIEVDKRNFLVPVDAQLKSDRTVEFETVPLDLVARAVEGASGLGLVILDACRDNPFAAAMQRAGANRSIGRGLARVEPAGEMLIAYAARGGTVAADGKGRNSPYTQALLADLEEPGLEVGLMFRKVRDAVLTSTGRKQEPFVYGSLSSKGFYLAGRLAAPRPQAPDRPTQGGSGASREQLAARAYEAAERLNTVEAYEAVVSGFPNSPFAALARGQIRKLKARVADPAAVEAALKLGRRDRALVQLGLTAQGHSPGPADGAIGPATRAALEAWQAKTGRKATGYLTLAGMSVLKAAGEVAERKAKAEQRRLARKWRPGKAFRDCADCPEMVVLPAGSFTMGSPSDEEGREDYEGPQHGVTIAKPFAVGKYEVTRAEFARFVAETGHATGGSCSTYEGGKWNNRSGRGWRDPGFAQTDRVPVVCVSWHDAKAYVAWLSKKTSKGYRLLSESEWEYAARAGTRTSRYWGNSVSAQCGHANGADLAAKGRVSGRTVAPCLDGHVHTAPVGSFGANGFRLHDLLGNVWEWVEDCLHKRYDGAPTDGRAWTAGDYCRRRVLRGGSWNDSPGFLRAAFRNRLSAGNRLFNLGFRVGRTLTP